MNRRKYTQSYALIILIGGLLAGCDSTQVDLDDRRGSTIEGYNPHSGPVASKQYLYEAFLDYGSETFSEGSLEWIVNFVDAYPVADGSITRFEYSVNRPSGSSGTHFSYRIPECALASYVEGSASPEPGDNNNANGDLEWGPSDLADGSNTITLDFANPAGADSVRWGVVEIGLKTPGSGSNQQVGEIVGPCRGRYTIQGTVFLNDYEGEEPDEIQGDDEPGLADVEVTLEELVDGAWVPDNSSGVRLTGGDEVATFGFYQFEVVIPPSATDGIIEGAPSGYRVRIAKQGSVGINSALFNDDVFEVTCLKEGTCVDQGDAITKVVSIGSNPDVAELNFGFEINTTKAIANFDNNSLVSDGFDRSYWSDVASQKSKKGEAPDHDLVEFESFLNCSSADTIDPSPTGAPDAQCIYDPDDFYADFGGSVDDLIETVFGADGISVAETVNILKNDSKGNPQEALRTQLLTALLNFTTGRGICIGTNLDPDGSCSAWDETATRSVIQNALVVLVKSGYSTVQKASSGSVGSNTELLSRVN